jgi:hypothetical protein
VCDGDDQRAIFSVLLLDEAFRAIGINQFCQETGDVPEGCTDVRSSYLRFGSDELINL